VNIAFNWIILIGCILYLIDIVFNDNNLLNKQLPASSLLLDPRFFFISDIWLKEF